MTVEPRSFIVKYNKIENQLRTKIKVGKAFDPETKKEKLPLKEFNAVWDTGATNTVISQRVIEECELVPIGIALVHTSGGVKLSEVFVVNIMLPTKVDFSFMRVTKSNLTQDIDVLIGMDIITQGDFAITDKNSKTTFSFRTPSILSIEFKADKTSLVDPPIIRTFPKLGRNDPCPCRSGKKYKDCCGKE